MSGAGAGDGQVVCVTGASGFVASWLVKDLLKNGYTVHATVRDVHDPTKVDHLKALPGAEQRLRLFRADLMQPGSFDAAVAGCGGVFHTASPVIFADIKDPQVELIQPAVNGTLNVLGSCLKNSSSIKRVVFTSTFGTVGVNRDAIMMGGHVAIDETWHSDPSFCEEIQAWYCLSKTLAEEAAWKFAKQYGIDLVTINPGFVIGSCLQPNFNFSSEDFLMLITQGKCLIAPFGIVPLVDVRDVARSHVLAFENPSAEGRYCVVALTMYAHEIFKVLHNLYPTLKLPKIDGENNTATGMSMEVSNEKVKSLGISFFPIEDSLKETIELLKERNLIVMP